MPFRKEGLHAASWLPPGSVASRPRAVSFALNVWIHGLRRHGPVESLCLAGLELLAHWDTQMPRTATPAPLCVAESSGLRCPRQRRPVRTDHLRAPFGTPRDEGLAIPSRSHDSWGAEPARCSIPGNTRCQWEVSEPGTGSDLIHGRCSNEEGSTTRIGHRGGSPWQH